MKQPGPYADVKVEVAEHAAIVTIDRPDVRNAISKSVMDHIRRVLEWLEGRDEICAVIFTGAGGKAFAAGADIAQIKARTLRDGLAATMQKLCRDIECFEKPTIAAVNGYALGGGCELALACDIRIASDNARLGLPELGLAIIPGAGGTQRLARLVGLGKAIEMILTGEIVDAEEAFRIGLISRVAPQEQLLPSALELAERIAGKGPLAVRLAKLAIRTGLEGDLGSGLVIEKLAQTILFTTEDKVEGATAFLERRKPNFRGK